MPSLEPHQRPLLGSTDGRIPVSKAAAIRTQLRQIIEDVAAAAKDHPAEHAEDEEMVLVHVLVGYFTPTPPTA